MSTEFNPLEKALIDAMSSNQKVAAFYEVLAKSNVWLIKKLHADKNSSSIEQVQMMEKKNRKLLPVFSSKFPIDKMFKQNDSIMMSFEEILNQIDGQTGIILNPDTPLSKLLIPQELQMMKSGKNYFKS
ncbi:SseB family protein [Metabacillus idriensis]|uniref:SseB family protein n=1 Tax=Metabacillus idriensis TaxID=324768 RepID=UPI002814181E|nr:SseB family protein [Metabacillus idriensis]MDR0139296.1 SseB family protein [Metabacillus idriensis]